MHRISTEKLKLLMLEKTIEEAAGLYLKALVDQESSSAEMLGNLAATPSTLKNVLGGGEKHTVALGFSRTRLTNSTLWRTK